MTKQCMSTAPTPRIRNGRRTRHFVESLEINDPNRRTISSTLESGGADEERQDISNTVSFGEDASETTIFGNSEDDLHCAFLAVAQTLLDKADTITAVASRKSQFIIKTEKLGPVLLNKLEMLTTWRLFQNDEEPTPFEDTLSWVTKSPKPQDPSHELVADLLTVVAKVVCETGDDAATREFVTYILHSVFLYEKGRDHYKKLLDNASFATILSDDLKARVNTIKKKKSFDYKLIAKKIMLEAIFGDDKMNSMVEAHDSFCSSKEKVFKGFPSRLKHVKEALGARFRLYDGPFESAPTELWILNALGGFYDDGATSIATDPAATTVTIPFPLISKLGSRSFPVAKAAYEELDQLHPGHGFLRCFLEDSKTHMQTSLLEQGFGTLLGITENDASPEVALGAGKISAVANSSTTSTGTGGPTNHLVSQVAEMIKKGESAFPLRLLILNDTTRPAFEAFKRTDKSDHFFDDLEALIEEFNKKSNKNWEAEPKNALERAGAGGAWSLKDLYIIGLLASSNFGTCFQVISVAHPTKSAVLKVEVFTMGQIPDYLGRPMNCHALLNNQRYVASIYAWFVMSVHAEKSGKGMTTKITAGVLMEECSKATFKVAIADLDEEENTPVKIRRIARYMHQILTTLSAAERKGVIHRDMKPANVLFAKGLGSPDTDERDHDKMEVRVIDFGLARTVHAESEGTKLCGTGKYRAPELFIEGVGTTTKVDVYSTGVMNYQLLTGETEYDSLELNFEHNELKVIESCTGGPELIDATKKMLASNPEDRILASEAVLLFQHVYQLCAKETGISCDHE